MPEVISYNAAKSTLTGDRIHLYPKIDLGESEIKDVDFTQVDPIAFGTSCSLEVTADTIDASNKMGGNWKNTRVGQLGWTITAEALYSFEENHTSFDKLLAAYANRDAIGVCLGIVATDEAAFEQARATGFKLDADDYVVAKGKAYITACSANFGTGGEVVSYSVTLTGDGELKTGAAPTPDTATAE